MLFYIKKHNLYCYYLFFYRIYFGESNPISDDGDNKSFNPRLMEYEKNKKRLIVFICDVFLDDPKVSYK